MDPLSLGAIGAQTLSLGIQFLYSQAGELLKRRRERDEGGEPGAVIEPSEAGAPGIARPPGAASIDYSALDELAAEIHGLRAALGDYVDGIEPVDPGNQRMLTTTDMLRRLLERVLGSDLTFRGEERPSGEVEVNATMEIGHLVGEATNVLADATTRGTIDSEVRVDRLESGSKMTGVDLTGGQSRDSRG